MIHPRERMLYEKYQREYQVTPSPSYLRQSVVLLNNKTEYKFDFNSNGSSEGILPDRLLAIQNKFAILSLGVYITRNEKGKEAKALLQTHANRGFFSNVKDFRVDDLNIIYAGHLKVVVNQTEIFDALDTQRFHCIPETQKQNSGANSPSTPESQFSYLHGAIPLEPVLKLSGREQNKFVITLPTMEGMQIAHPEENFEHRLVLYGRGFLLQGVAKKEVN